MLDLVSSTQEHRLQTSDNEAGCELESLPVTPSIPPSPEGLTQELKDLDSRVFSINFFVSWISVLPWGSFAGVWLGSQVMGHRVLRLCLQAPPPPLTQHKSPSFQGFLSMSNLSLSGDSWGFSLVTCVGQPAPALCKVWIFLYSFFLSFFLSFYHSVIHSRLKFTFLESFLLSFILHYSFISL